MAAHNGSSVCCVAGGAEPKRHGVGRVRCDWRVARPKTEEEKGASGVGRAEPLKRAYVRASKGEQPDGHDRAEPERRASWTFVAPVDGPWRREAATVTAASAEEVEQELERRAAEARERLQERERKNREEWATRWAHKYGFCNPPVLLAGARGPLASRRAAPARGSEGGSKLAGGRPPQDMGDWETNIGLELNIIGEQEAGTRVEGVGRSADGRRALTEAQARARVQVAVREWLAGRHLARELARWEAEWEEPGWLRASVRELERMQRVEAAAVETQALAAAEAAAEAEAAYLVAAEAKASLEVEAVAVAKAARGVVAARAACVVAAEEGAGAEAKARAEAEAKAVAEAEAAEAAKAEARAARAEAKAKVKAVKRAARAAEAREPEGVVRAEVVAGVEGLVAAAVEAAEADEV